MLIQEITRPNNRDAAVKFFRDRGWASYRGTFTNVLVRSDRDYALKIFSTMDTGYLEYLKICIANKSNPYFPKIIGQPMKVKDAPNGYYAIRIEKLVPWIKGQNPNLDEVYSVIRHCIHLYDDRTPSDFEKEFVLDSIRNLEDKNLEQALLLISECIEKNNIEPDMTVKNVMIRPSTGQLVIIDPFWPRQN